MALCIPEPVSGRGFITFCEPAVEVFVALVALVIRVHKTLRMLSHIVQTRQRGRRWLHSGGMRFFRRAQEELRKITKARAKPQHEREVVVTVQSHIHIVRS